MVSLKIIGRLIDFLAICTAESTEYRILSSFLIILNIILKSFLEIKIFEKHFLDLKKVFIEIF